MSTSEVARPGSVGDEIEHLRLATERLVQAFDLEPRPLDPRWARHEGEVGRSPVTLHTRLYRGRGLLEELRLAWTTSVDDAMASLTVLALPRADVERGVFTSDLVAFGERLRFVALDPCATASEPVDLAPPEQQALAASLRPLPLPPHLLAPFSSAAALGRGGEATRRWLVPAYEACLRELGVGLAAASRQPAAEGLRARRRLLTALQHNKREGRVLASIFGGPWSESYLTDHFLALGDAGSPATLRPPRTRRRSHRVPEPH